MFTGIIKETGIIKNILKTPKGKMFTVIADKSIIGKKKGESIAVNGVCTTITSKRNNRFSFLAMPETLEITNLNKLKENDKINLEPAITINQALDGHFVQGHIDTMGEVVIFDNQTEKAFLVIKIPETIKKFIAYKGSIAINGVSLTISKVDRNNIRVDLIPHTLKITNLIDLKPKDKVNIEIDILAKYINNMLEAREDQCKYEFLLERGFI